MTIKQGDFFPIMKQPTDEYIVVSALASELPNALPEKLLFTGVGKVNATHILTRYLVNNPQIRTVINFGTCGGIHGVKKGEIVKVTTFVQGDMYCGNLTEGKGITYGDDPAIAGTLNYGTEGVICRTQDQFVDNIETLDKLQYLLEGNKFNIVDMEAYALAKVCAYMNVDFICYKYVSDDADEEASDDWEENVHKGEDLFYDILEKEHLFERLQ
jgi:adenosylhomocysteine nucleosidase|tara:strand:+ start:391 stop:1032 length:642 start_codon:yes stop_codon:yes gene_type:complete